jgi:hypothetical protein
VRLDSAFRVLFVVYCLEAGLFLLVAPWTGSWERLALALGAGLLRRLGELSWLRGLVSGFGCVHLIWAAHDIDFYLRRSPAQ